MKVQKWPGDKEEAISGNKMRGKYGDRGERKELKRNARVK